MISSRMWIVLGAVNGFFAVAAGAFAAHALKDRLSLEMLAIFETASRYQMIHALAILVVAVLRGSTEHRSLRWAGWFFLIGILVFSGSLYALSLTGIRWLGAITPVGGVAFLLGWASLAWGSAFYPVNQISR